MGGKDAASPRYIFTRLANITRAIFPIDDDPLLTYLDDDGQSIEPTFYVPIIPMLLVNGSAGIGTGWSTTVPNYNPRDVVKNIKHILNGEPQDPLEPWYRHFRGTIKKDIKTFKVTGCWEKVSSDTIRITELPIGIWTQNYKKFLENV